MGRSCKIRNDCSTDHCEQNPRVGDRVRQDHVFGIDEYQRQDRSGEGEIEGECKRPAVMPGDHDKQKGSQSFDRWIAGRNWRAAGTTLAPQNQKTEDRNIVISFDLRSALWTG